MTSKSRVDYDLLFAIWLRELYEEDFGRKVVNISDSKTDKRIGELMSNDLEELDMLKPFGSLRNTLLHLKMRIFASCCCSGGFGRTECGMMEGQMRDDFSDALSTSFFGHRRGDMSISPSSRLIHLVPFPPFNQEPSQRTVYIGLASTFPPVVAYQSKASKIHHFHV